MVTKTPKTPTPSLGLLQNDMKNKSKALRKAVNTEATAARAHKRATEARIAAKTSLDSVVREIDEAAASLTSAARS